jgi:hypothetical protein
VQDGGVKFPFTFRVESEQIWQPMSEGPPETREELVQHLEKLTGRTLRTRAEIQAYVREVSERKATDLPSVRRWLNAKRITLVALLAFGVVQYYILDVLLEIASMRTTTFFVPASTRMLKSMIDTLV